MRKIIVILLLYLPATLVAKGIADHAAGIWSIAPTQTMNRWIIVHNLEEAKNSEIFHIEVIGRNIGDEVWQIKHLVPHMAITEEALTKSVVAPLQKGGVYPETYENAYANWLRENGGKGGSICTTSVLECM